MLDCFTRLILDWFGNPVSWFDLLVPINSRSVQRYDFLLVNWRYVTSEFVPYTALGFKLRIAHLLKYHDVYVLHRMLCN